MQRLRFYFPISVYAPWANPITNPEGDARLYFLSAAKRTRLLSHLGRFCVSESRKCFFSQACIVTNGKHRKNVLCHMLKITFFLLFCHLRKIHEKNIVDRFPVGCCIGCLRQKRRSCSCCNRTGCFRSG